MKSRELLRALLAWEIEAIKESDDLNPVSELDREFNDADQEERAGVLRERLRVLQEAVEWIRQPGLG